MKSTPLRPALGPPIPTVAALGTSTPIEVVKPNPAAPFAQDGRAPRALAPQARPALGADGAAAAATNLLRALDGAISAQSAGRPGPLRGRLAAAAAALDALSQAGHRPALTDALTKAQTLASAEGPEAPLAATLSSKIVELERVRLLNEVGTVSPTPRATLEAMLDGVPEPESVMATFAAQYPGAAGLGQTQASLRAALDVDLSAGDVGADIRACFEAHGVPEADVEGFFGMMAEARAAFAAGFGAEASSAKDRDMQRTGWVHTRVEVAKAARAFADRVKVGEGSGRRLLSTLMGALASDGFKDASPHSLLWHNRPGAELVLPLLAARNLPSETTQSTLPTAMKLAHEHQITPAMFMSGAMRGALLEAKVAPEVIEEIAGKVGDPLGAPASGGEIQFSPAAQAALSAIGLSGWATMDPKSPHFVESQTVALADVLQYVAPDGIIKIAVDIRDPEQPAPFMRDPNIRTAVDSSVGFSFAKGMEAIVDEDLHAYGLKMAADVGDMLEAEVYPEVERRLAQALGVQADGALPRIPYWNQDVSTEGALSDAERSSVRLVKETLRDVLAEAGGVNLSPFTQKES